MVKRCSKCNQVMKEDVIEDIEITDTGIYLNANEVYRCSQCGHVEQQHNGREIE